MTYVIGERILNFFRKFFQSRFLCGDFCLFYTACRLDLIMISAFVTMGNTAFFKKAIASK